MTEVECAILRTLAYFDVFRVPLTALETWRYLYWETEDKSPDLGDVELALEKLISERLVASKGDGFFALRQGQSESKLRRVREADAIRKWRRLYFATRLLHSIPFLKGLALVNTLAIGGARPDSDIDVLIIAKPGRIFTVRFLTVLLTSIFRIRRYGKKTTNRLCLSFFITENSLDFDPLTKKPNDPHLQYWASTMMVLIDRGVFDRLWDENKSWFANIPNLSLRRVAQAISPFPGALWIRGVLVFLLNGRLGGWFERWVKLVQTKRFTRNNQSRSKMDTTDVVISDDVLKFHERDKRLVVRRAWYDRLRRYGISFPKRQTS